MDGKGFFFSVYVYIMHLSLTILEFVHASCVKCVNQLTSSNYVLNII
jgi:hypothetical protein